MGCLNNYYIYERRFRNFLLKKIIDLKLELRER